MSAWLLARELELAGLRPERSGNVTWRACCPVCWTPDEPGRKTLGVWEWADGHEEVACWNPTCESNRDIIAEPAYPDVTAFSSCVLWTAIIARIGSAGIRRAWGMKRAAAIESAVALHPPRIRVPR